MPKLTLSELKDLTQTLYQSLYTSHYIPQQLVIIGRKSLLPGYFLSNLLNTTSVSYVDISNLLQNITGNRLLTLSLHLKDDEELTKIRQSLHGRMFKIGCLFNSCTRKEPDYYVLTIPPDTDLEVKC